MRELGKLDPTLRLLGETLNKTLQLEADLKKVAEALRRLKDYLVTGLTLVLNWSHS